MAQSGYLGKEVVHKSLVLHRNLNVVSPGIALLFNMRTKNKIWSGQNLRIKFKKEKRLQLGETQAIQIYLS